VFTLFIALIIWVAICAAVGEPLASIVISPLAAASDVIEEVAVLNTNVLEPMTNS